MSETDRETPAAAGKDPYCLPRCNRLDGHDGRHAGACMLDGEVLKPGPLDLVHRHPDIPVMVPRRGARWLP